MEKQVGIPLKGSGKGDGTSRYCSVGGQVIGLSIGLMVLISAFPYFLQAQTVSGNETVESSKQTMELMPVSQVMPIVFVISNKELMKSRMCNAQREGNSDTYVDGIKVRGGMTFPSCSNTISVLTPGTPAKYENRGFSGQKSPSR